MWASTKRAKTAPVTAIATFLPIMVRQNATMRLSTGILRSIRSVAGWATTLSLSTSCMLTSLHTTRAHAVPCTRPHGYEETSSTGLRQLFLQPTRSSRISGRTSVNPSRRGGLLQPGRCAARTNDRSGPGRANGAHMIGTRKETDGLGVVEVPADKLWGAQ